MKTYTILLRFHPWTLWTVPAQASMDGNWVILITGDEFLFDLILISTVVFFQLEPMNVAIQNYQYSSSLSLFHNHQTLHKFFKTFFCEFNAMCFTVPNCLFTSLSWKSTLRVSKNLAFNIKGFCKPPSLTLVFYQFYLVQCNSGVNCQVLFQRRARFHLSSTFRHYIY